MLIFMSYYFDTYTKEAQITKEWMIKGKIHSKTIRLPYDSGKAIKKYRQFLTLLEEKKLKQKLIPNDKKLIHNMGFILEENFIYL